MKDAHNWVQCAMLGLLLGAGLGPTEAASDDANQAQDAAQALADQRRKMIEQCERNRGTKEDCEKQVDTELAAEGIDRQHSRGGGERRGDR